MSDQRIEEIRERWESEAFGTSAHAPEDIAYLLDEIDRLRTALEGYEEVAGDE